MPSAFYHSFFLIIVVQQFWVGIIELMALVSYRNNHRWECAFFFSLCAIFLVLYSLFCYFFQWFTLLNYHTFPSWLLVISTKNESGTWYSDDKVQNKLSSSIRIICTVFQFLLAGLLPGLEPLILWLRYSIEDNYIIQ